MPLWADCFNIASIVEYVGTGVQGCKDTSPTWTAECLVEAIGGVVNDKDKRIRERAAQLGKEAQAAPGRHGAANIIADLAAHGYE